MIRANRAPKKQNIGVAEATALKQMRILRAPEDNRSDFEIRATKE
jgi:hypothetical protein